jgi:hypothetical protein
MSGAAVRRHYQGKLALRDHMCVGYAASLQLAGSRAFSLTRAVDLNHETI